MHRSTHVPKMKIRSLHSGADWLFSTVRRHEKAARTINELIEPIYGNCK
jgi:hypothetical protein